MLEFLILYSYTALVLIYVFTLYFLLLTVNKCNHAITITLNPTNDNAVITINKSGILLSIDGDIKTKKAPAEKLSAFCEGLHHRLFLLIDKNRINN